MALLYQVECVGLCIFTFILLSLARTNWYRLDECNTSHSIHSVEGAIIDSQDGAYYTTDSRNCSLIFQTLGQPSTFLIKILHIDIRSDTIFCRDQLSLTELYNLTSTSSVILDRFCGDSTQLPIPNVVYTQGSYLRLKWVTGTGSSGHRGFSISLTAVSHDPVVCAAKGKFQCDNFTCIGQSLVCDGTSNCLHGEDETDCVNSQLADFQVARGNSVMFSSTTTIPSTTVKLSAGSTTEQPKANEVYLWLPLIVVVIFTGIMVTLIMVGRRGEDSPYDRTSDEHNRLQLEMNANAGYEHSEGMPETPPPTYDAIARQTSYVSHISQTSDQISIPPEYEEAVEWSNEHGRQRQSRLRHVTRSRSAGRSTGMGTSSSGSRGPNFARLFSRSVSVTTSAHGVDRSGSVTTQNTTTSTSDNNTTELSSVFADTSPEIVIHPAPLPRPASHPLMSTPQTMHQGIPPPPTEVIGDDDVFDDSHQEETPSTQDSQNPTASDNFHPSFFL